MKFMARHPNGAAYELTREELSAPNVVQQLQIDDSWTVRVGADWVPLPAFLRTAPDEISERTASVANSRAGAFLAASARWTPASVFSLTLRLVGLFLLFQVFSGTVALISGVAISKDLPLPMPDRVWPSAVIAYLCYLGLGVYLVLGARSFVAWVFSLGNPEA
jgi:hypothetical protein